MDDVLALGSVSDYCKFLGVACRNELVEAIDFTKLDSVARRRKMFGFYTLVFVENADGNLASGRACSRSAESWITAFIFLHEQVNSRVDIGALLITAGSVLMLMK